ncbi:exodeoxyribonuclease VII small subunit [Streptobacillus moniliformis]|uniref:Exodeoxyribonuclease 7 small subunit n=1 Tax=Streptobacillus moniliformis (strain ATCC 14647 / DSM 12112 / NCTC 10651 / 9901) TaxID=519441 RepID=D1AXS1_STRM9|nr:exodeoxyribonuclease VII small subunit [Streptobacillus moniliformis]ACZ01097.1 Exonuclease VII small subunit [Streptobacillus moniliformis DSM 12112]AVL42537.1 exodeoxyribonuclease VII small subunit [Streptobacillus moniliformis]QXW65869.1 exodeoxyribonuclease VII small subunit [Streptobacillus moniliformis]SQA13761.1 Exodeoxyribonuclease 7 small subunit [Streptobacillus moniliformis]
MAKKNFETILEEIKESIIKLESFDISLDDSITEYEKAIKLIKEAEKKLKEVEGKLEVIKINVEKE